MKKNFLTAVFHNLSIRSKQMVIIVLTSSIALLLTCAAFIANEQYTFRKAIIHDLSILADVMVTHSEAALELDDSEAAEETLSALKANKHIVSACIYSKEGALFAKYTRDFRKSSTENPVAFPIRPPEEGHSFHEGHLQLVRKIIAERGPLGTLYIKSDLQHLYSRLKWYMGIAMLVMTASLLVSLLLSSVFQRLISEPILHLVRTAKAVSEQKDYSIRAIPHGGDELGVLIKVFNEMLEEVQKRDLELERHSQHLEEQVTERTVELLTLNEQLRVAKEKAEVANRAKSEFLANNEP